MQREFENLKDTVSKEMDKCIQDFNRMVIARSNGMMNEETVNTVWNNVVQTKSPKKTKTPVEPRLTIVDIQRQLDDMEIPYRKKATRVELLNLLQNPPIREEKVAEHSNFYTENEDPSQYKSLTVPQLKEKLRFLNIGFNPSAKKKELLELLTSKPTYVIQDADEQIDSSHFIIDVTEDEESGQIEC